VLLSSGLWCDLCRKPIFGDWWNISIKRMNGDNYKGHSCKECKDAYDNAEKNTDTETKEGEK